MTPNDIDKSILTYIKGKISATLPPEKNAHKILKMETPTAYGLLRACKLLFGSDCINWEPETFWLLIDRHGYNLSQDNRDKIMAAVAAIHDPAYFNEARAFNAMCVGLNDDELNPEEIQPLEAPFMCWTVFETHAILMDEIRQKNVTKLPKFDYEVQELIAANLYNDGFILAPVALDFAQDELDAMYKHVNGLMASDIDKELKKIVTQDLTKIVLEEDNPIHIQVARHLRCYAYIEDRLEQASIEAELIPR